jgi:hypothetical protein
MRAYLKIVSLKVTGYRQPAATNRFRINHQNTMKAASRRWNPLSEKSAKAIRSFLRVA